MTFIESPQPGKLGIQHNVHIPPLTSDMALVKTVLSILDTYVHVDIRFIGSDRKSGGAYPLTWLPALTT